MKRTFLIFAFAVLFISCKESKQVDYKKISGATMGTTYNVTIQYDAPTKIKREIDSLLVQVNLALSTYIPESTISLFNNNYKSYLLEEIDDRHLYFIDNYKLAKEIYDKSDGAFEPTIMPIVNYWGFGYTGKNKVTKIDSNEISILMQHVGLDKVSMKSMYLEKNDEKVELDFSGIAKGYGVDQIGKLLMDRNITNFYIEIGGEVYANGLNGKGQKWRTGISIPKTTARKESIQQIIEISGRGIATSGNYENYYQVEEGIISHTINPKTGFPERSQLLSATILAPNCAMADGFATACMVIGLEKSIEMINLQEEIEGILIFVDEKDNLSVYDSTKK